MKKVVLALVMVLFSAASVMAQGGYKLHRYDSQDGGILWKISPNGKWGVIRLGTSAGGGNATPKLYDVETGKASEVTYAGRTFELTSVSDDGNVVVGSLSGRPAAYNRQTGKVTIFPMRDLWQSGTLTSVTPDGKWAVGEYNGFNGKISDEDELDHDFYYSTLFVNVETGDTIYTPNLPKRDMAHLDQHAMKFSGITPDGRYIIGEMSWYIIQPQSGVVFVYDTTTNTYDVIGFKENDKGPWEPLYADLYNVESPVFSPNGKWLGAMAYMSHAQEGNAFSNEYVVPMLYNMETKELRIFDDSESSNISVGAVDDNGTIFGNPESGSPLRDFRIFYKNKYWISLTQICKQHYGFDFLAKTGYGNTGTVNSVSGDGSKIICFPDPLGESYCMDFGQPIENICDGIDLLDNYSITPSNGSIFSQLSNVEINFGRAVQVLGTGKNVHLYKADGTKIADGLTAGNQGLAMKAGSKNAVNAVFRTRTLEAGVDYYVTIDAGAIAVANDATRTNKEIRVNYKGRSNGPVQMIKVAPENNSSLKAIDASASYILLTFDAPVKLTDHYGARVVRVEDGSVVGYLSLSEGNTEATKNQVLMTSGSNINLYDGLEYKVILDAGSVSDYSGSAISYNEEIQVTYKGTYIREIGSDSELFADDFNDPALSYALWLRFEGDHKTPLATMQNWGFDADNMPWTFGMADNSDYADCYAGSHSLYAPSAQSDDWMMTPQILLPEEGEVVLEFDAQNYMADKKDVLKLYVFEEEFEIPYLSNAWMSDIREMAVLLDEITLNAGATQDKTEGEWTHYRYDLSAWNGKNIYVAFVNQNTNQSAMFVDNVVVKRELRYTIGFNNSDRVVNMDNIQISGRFTVKTDEPVSSISLKLCDASGNIVSKIDWPTLSGSIKDRPIPFSFAESLPLTKGKETAYSIEITMGDYKDTYSGTISNLVFEPTKRVVLEEMTGVNCPNCPLGIIAIEKCEKAYGDQFIPLSLHTYPGDPWSGSLSYYSDFLTLNAAPTARINRIPGVFSPIVSLNGVYVDTYAEKPLWYDIVGQEIAKLPLFDVELKASRSADDKTVNLTTSLRYAMDADNQQLAVFVVLTEDGLVSYQENNFGMVDQPVLGEWGNGGLMSSAYAYPVTHNDVVRSVVGQTFSGVIGLFPTSAEAGKTYTTTFASPWPASVVDNNNVNAVAMIIDTQTGEVVNAAKTKVLSFADGVEDVPAQTSALCDVYSLSGVRVLRAATQSQINALPAGVYVIGGKKIMINK